jgi:hypothetical protein
VEIRETIASLAREMRTPLRVVVATTSSLAAPVKISSVEGPETIASMPDPGRTP